MITLRFIFSGERGNATTTRDQKKSSSFYLFICVRKCRKNVAQCVWSFITLFRLEISKSGSGCWLIGLSLFYTVSYLCVCVHFRMEIFIVITFPMDFDVLFIWIVAPRLKIFEGPTSLMQIQIRLMQRLFLQKAFSYQKKLFSLHSNNLGRFFLRFAVIVILFQFFSQFFSSLFIHSKEEV